MYTMDSLSLVSENNEEVMPTYDYKCIKCEYVEEHFHSMSETFFALCPKCNNEMVRMVGGGSGVIFKGDGWTPKYHKRNVK